MTSKIYFLKDRNEIKTENKKNYRQAPAYRNEFGIYLVISISAVSGLYFQSFGSTLVDW